MDQQHADDTEKQTQNIKTILDEKIQMDMNDFDFEKKLSVEEIKMKLREAVKRRDAYMREKEKLDKAMKQIKDDQAREAIFQLQNTKVLPVEVDESLWDEEQLLAKKAMDILERNKYKPQGHKLKELSFTEKQQFIQNQIAKETKQRPNLEAFYEDHPEWFAFETRLRDMILATVEPVIKKTLQDANYVQKIVQNQSYQKYKIEEFEHVIQKIVKRQSFEDELEMMIKNLEKVINDHDAKITGKYVMIDQVKEHCNEQYLQMKKERTETINRMEKMESQVHKFKEQIEMSMIKIEADLKMFENKQNTFQTKIFEQINDMDQKTKLIQVSQENISKQFITFGEQIEISKYKIDNLTPIVDMLRRTKANEDEIKKQIENLNNNIQQNRSQVEDFRVEISKTEKYIQCYQPISFVTEMDKMFRAVFPRRRHLLILKNYTNQRQLELEAKIKELEHVSLDKKQYEMADQYTIDRAQSIDSNYIRDGIRLFKQTQNVKNQRAAAGGNKMKKTLYNTNFNMKRNESKKSIMRNTSDKQNQNSFDKQVSQAKVPKRKQAMDNLKRMSRLARSQSHYEYDNNMMQRGSIKPSKNLEITNVDPTLSPQNILSPADDIALDNSDESCRSDLDDTSYSLSSCEQSKRDIIQQSSRLLYFAIEPDQREQKLQRLKSQIKDENTIELLMQKIKEIEMNQAIQNEKQIELQKELENERLLGLKDDKSEKLSTIKSEDSVSEASKADISKGQKSNKKDRGYSRQNLLKSSQIPSVRSSSNSVKISEKGAESPADEQLDGLASKLNKLLNKMMTKRHKFKRNHTHSVSHKSKHRLKVMNIDTKNNDVESISQSNQNRDNEDDDDKSFQEFEEYDDFGEDESEAINFVEQYQVDEINKKLEEQIITNENLRSLITDLSNQVNIFKNEISPQGLFNFETYTKDQDSIYSKMTEDFNQVHKILKEHEETENRDRTLLYTEIQNTNRRIFVTKKEVRDDFQLFSKILNDIDGKQTSFLVSGINILELANMMSKIVSIQASLMKQDEIDKKGIFLMGLREDESNLTNGQLAKNQHKRFDENFGDLSKYTLGEQEIIKARVRDQEMQLGAPPKTIIDYDHQCFTCGDQPSKVISAFKMACLTYKPGKVYFNGDDFTRDSLLKMKEDVILQLNNHRAQTQNLLKKMGQQISEDHSNAHRTDTEKGQVMFYDSRLSQNDLDMIAIIERKKDPFPESKASLAAQSQLMSPMMNQIFSDQSATQFNSQMILIEDNQSDKDTVQTLKLAQKNLKNQVRAQTGKKRPSGVDRYNNEHQNLIALEIRDQADKAYIDLANRDINGNVKNPIGNDIDDMTTRHLYINDPVYNSKLEKLAMIKQKSANLKAITTVQQLILPKITTDHEDSYKGIFDQNIQKDLLALKRQSNKTTMIQSRLDNTLRTQSVLGVQRKSIESGGWNQLDRTTRHKSLHSFDSSSKCLAMQDKGYRKRKEEKKLVDPNTVSSINKILQRNLNEDLQVGSGKHFKYEEHFAKRSSIQFERFGGRQNSNLITNEEQTPEKSEKPHRVTISLERKQIIVESPKIQIGMKLKQQYQHI